MITNDNDQPSRRVYWLSGLTGLLLIPLLVIWWPSCKQYPTVTSRDGLVMIQLLCTACNTQDTARLEAAETRLKKLALDGKISRAEQEAFAGIIRTARSGDWANAEVAALTMAQDQLGEGDATADHHEEPKPKKRS